MTRTTRNPVSFIIKSLLPALTGVLFLLGSNASSAATCNFPSDVTLDPGEGFFQQYQLSNFAYGIYYFQVITSGQFTPIGLNVQGFPGITQGDTKGFLGTGTSMGVNFHVHPNVQPGAQSFITIRVVNTAGQIICGKTFTVTVDGSTTQPQWTNWLDRDSAGGTGDWEHLAGFPSSEVCASPTDIQARVVGTTSVFSPSGSTPEPLFRFSPSDGLVCRNADQVDGICNDYEVRFLCP